MNIPPAIERISSARQTALTALLANRTEEGHWIGELSASALSSATAVSALAIVTKHGRRRVDDHAHLIGRGLAWLSAHQNPDGGWGDTVKSISNISTTMLCRAAFHIANASQEHIDCLKRADGYMYERYGTPSEQHAEAVRARYGKDRTFSVPILMTSALAGLVSWKEVPSLPFELACFPQSWFRFLRLPVVSYALPALIALGQAVYHHRPPRNPLARIIRHCSISKSLRVLEAIQPSSGGFLEATPLTSFVTMGLASIGQADHPVARKAVEFLTKSVRPDGSWPIDTNLATWLTTLSVNALAAAGALGKLDRLLELREWISAQQYQARHPYTGADPGGWAWTDLPGGVPDVDDTSGAILALVHLKSAIPADAEHESKTVNPSESGTLLAARQILERYMRFAGQREPLNRGAAWLRQLQNRDGGWPTFCRGWANLPFDRSGCDLTAHAIRSLNAAETLANETAHATRGGFSYLARKQRPDGSWPPLWFGNQYASNDENPTYGTARVLAAYRDLSKMNAEPARKGIAWLLAAQNADGGWGGDRGVPSSIEETALAVEVLIDASAEAEPAVNRGLGWLVQQVESGGLANPTPIGFYFAKLWYFEKLYPIIFTVAALGRALKKFSPHRDPALGAYPNKGTGSV